MLIHQEDWAFAGALHWPTKLIARDPWELFLFVRECAQRGDSR